MTSTRTSRLLARLSFAGLIGIGLAGGVAGTAVAAPGPGDIKPGPTVTTKVKPGDLTAAPTVPTTVKPGPLHKPDQPLSNPTDPCKATSGNPKGCPKPDPCAPTPGGPEKCPEPDPCSGDACDRPVPGKPTFTG